MTKTPIAFALIALFMMTCVNVSGQPVNDESDVVAVGVNGLPPPVRTKTAQPVVPKGVTPRGVVLLELIVSTKGRVETVKIVRGVRPAQPLLDQAAVEAAKKWEYAPTVIGSEPRRVRVRSTVSYNR